MKNLKSWLLFCVLCPLNLWANGIDGYWLVPDDDNDGAIQGAALIYEHNGARYGRMVVIFDENTQKISETTSKPLTMAKGIAGNPPICGLDFIWDLKFNEDSGRYVGTVIDPDTGRVYKCEVWFDSQKKSLIVRGEFLIFGKNEYWEPAGEKHLPQEQRLNVKDISPKKVSPKQDS